MEWGVPALPEDIERPSYSMHKIYETYEEAIEFVKQIRKVNSPS